MEDNFPRTWGAGDGFGMIQGHYIYCALYFYYDYISSNSDHQALHPGRWGPLSYHRAYGWLWGAMLGLPVLWLCLEDGRVRYTWPLLVSCTDVWDKLTFQAMSHWENPLVPFSPAHHAHTKFNTFSTEMLLCTQPTFPFIKEKDHDRETKKDRQKDRQRQEGRREGWKGGREGGRKRKNEEVKRP